MESWEKEAVRMEVNKMQSNCKCRGFNQSVDIKLVRWSAIIGWIYSYKKIEIVGEQLRAITCWLTYIFIIFISISFFITFTKFPQIPVVYFVKNPKSSYTLNCTIICCYYFCFVMYSVTFQTVITMLRQIK